MEQTTALFKALGDTTRLRILAILLGGPEHCVCNLMAALDLPQSTVSRHLAALKNSGWIKGRRQNKWMYYRMSQGPDILKIEVATLLQTALPKMKQMVVDQQRLDAFLQERDAVDCG